MGSLCFKEVTYEAKENTSGLSRDGADRSGVYECMRGEAGSRTGVAGYDAEHDRIAGCDRNDAGSECANADVRRDGDDGCSPDHGYRSGNERR